MGWEMMAQIGGQAGAGGLGGHLAARQKENEAAIAKYNALVMDQQAKAIKIRTKFRQERAAEEAKRIEGELHAAIGGAGVVSTQGAPLMALALQKSESDLENYLIGYEGRVEEEQAKNRATEFRMIKKQLDIAADMARGGGWLGAGASAMGGWTAQTPQTTPTTVSTTGYATGYSSTATPGAGRF